MILFDIVIVVFSFIAIIVVQLHLPVVLRQHTKGSNLSN